MFTSSFSWAFLWLCKLRFRDFKVSLYNFQDSKAKFASIDVQITTGKEAARRLMQVGYMVLWNIANKNSIDFVSFHYAADARFCHTA